MAVSIPTIVAAITSIMANLACVGAQVLGTANKIVREIIQPSIVGLAAVAVTVKRKIVERFGANVALRVAVMLFVVLLIGVVFGFEMVYNTAIIVVAMMFFLTMTLSMLLITIILALYYL